MEVSDIDLSRIFFQKVTELSCFLSQPKNSIR